MDGRSPYRSEAPCRAGAVSAAPLLTLVSCRHIESREVAAGNAVDGHPCLPPGVALCGLGSGQGQASGGAVNESEEEESEHCHRPQHDGATTLPVAAGEPGRGTRSHTSGRSAANVRTGDGTAHSYAGLLCPSARPSGLSEGERGAGEGSRPQAQAPPCCCMAEFEALLGCGLAQCRALC